MNRYAIVQAILANMGDGITVNPEGETYSEGGYMVADPAYGQVLVVGPYVISDIVRWLHDIPGTVQYLGAWSHEGRLYLDVVDIIEDRDEAIRLGQERNQIAIWDAGNQVEIPTGGTGEVA